jgi:iron transport multicopper oxidase
MQELAAGGHAPPAYIADQCIALHKPIAGNAAGHTGADVLDLSGLKVGPYPQRLGWHPRGIGAMFACVFTAVLGMASVGWYALAGEEQSEEEMEREVSARIEKREKEGGKLGRLWKRSQVGSA